MEDVNASIDVTGEGAMMHVYVILIRGINVGGRNNILNRRDTHR